MKGEFCMLILAGCAGTFAQAVGETASPAQSRQKAFPTAFGGGAFATGGRGGNVYHVTNLHGDYREGSFGWALSRPRPATIVFEVSGTIDLENTMNISRDDLTIAGQTAPPGGITITSTKGKRFKGQDANNIIMRYLRIRPLESGNDAFEFFGNKKGAYNIILDHLSLSYGGDEALSLRGRKTHNVTYQRCLIAESKTGSLFGDSNVPGNSYNNSFLDSLFWNVSHRTPNTSSDGRVDILNNVTQQHQYRLTWARGDIQLNHRNNYYALGLVKTPFTSNGSRRVNIAQTGCQQKIYSAGNIMDKGLHPESQTDNRPLWASNGDGYTNPAAPAHFIETPYPMLGARMTIKTAAEAYRDVITNVGANASLGADGSVTSYLDQNDTDYLAVVARGEGAGEPYQMHGRVRSWFGEKRYAAFVAGISSKPINTRPKNHDTDRDGMPDQWEKATFGNLSKDGRGDTDGDGYTDLEEYLNLVDLKDATTNRK